MKIENFTWLEDVVEKLQVKHHVRLHEVIEILDSRPVFRFLEKGNREGENLYLALGQTEAGRYLSVFFILKPMATALVISARDMALHERRQYGHRKR